MRSEQQGTDLGRARIEPDAPIIAGRPGAWNIVYTCGPRGISVGGAVRFDVPYGFSPPQTVYSMEVGYTTVTTSNPDVALSLHHQDPQEKCRNQGVWAVHVFAVIEEGALGEGDTVTLHYGKGHGGGLKSVGAHARHFEGEAEFAVLVDPDGNRSAEAGGFLLVDDPQPMLWIVGDEPHHVHVVIPSTLEDGATFPARISVRDRNHNNISTEGLKLAIESGQGVECRTQGDAFECRMTEPSPQPVRVTVRDETGRVAGTSNPALPLKDNSEPRLYWGDTHVMTVISAGLSRPGPTLQYARDVSFLDFCAITDGDDADGYFSDEEWDETKKAVREYHDPGKFVTLLASECHERRVAGDKNIYYRTDDADLIRWSDLEGPLPEGIWKRLGDAKALTIPHHTVSGSAGADPWGHHDPRFQRLVEIYSIWGNSECEGCDYPNYWHNNWKNSVQNALAKGYRLGIIASGDSHDGLAGNSSWMRLRQGYRNGLAAVYAPELTREAVFDALYDRYCYGTTGARIVLEFTLNEHRMGSDLYGDEHRKARALQVRAIGTADIERITVIRNGAEVHIHEGRTDDEAFEWEDSEDFDAVALKDDRGEQFIYYYVRVKQKDGELAWSSPVWIA